MLCAGADAEVKARLVAALSAVDTLLGRADNPLYGRATGEE